MIDLSMLTPKVSVEFLLRWIHILAGITWIGFLYWFNLVNVNFQKALDAELKPKVNPNLILPTLWFFRWGAVLTVLSGFFYYLIILHGEEVGAGKPLAVWLLTVVIGYAILFKVIKPEGTLNDGKLLGAIVAVLVILLAGTIVWSYHHLGVRTNPSYAIGIGGGIGVWMFANVWSIIWPSQKIILGVVSLPEGADKVKLARRVFLASRTNAWLSIPMIFFMGVSTHLPLIRWE